MNPRAKHAPARAIAPVVLSLLLFSTAASAASPANSGGKPETVSISTSLVTPFFGAYYLEGKLRASGAFAALLNASYLGIEDDDWKLSAGTVGAGLGYYFGADALRGWYVEGIGEIWFASWRHQPTERAAPITLGYAGVAIVGYQFVCVRGPVLDLGLGATAFHVPSKNLTAEGTTASPEAMTRVYPAAKVNVGWAF